MVLWSLTITLHLKKTKNKCIAVVVDALKELSVPSKKLFLKVREAEEIVTRRALLIVTVTTELNWFGEFPSQSLKKKRTSSSHSLFPQCQSDPKCNFIVIWTVLLFKTLHKKHELHNTRPAVVLHRTISDRAINEQLKYPPKVMKRFGLQPKKKKSIWIQQFYRPPVSSDLSIINSDYKTKREKEMQRQ